MNDIIALFDLDGVILDTETQYTIFWNMIGKSYLNRNDFGLTIKGQSLTHIYSTYFNNMDDIQNEVTLKLNDFEKSMNMEYIDGFEHFIKDLKANNVKTAIVTSSNREKMKSVLANHPELENYFDKILTSEMFTKSKPDPDPYLSGAKAFNASSDDCFVFEDSFHGLESGRKASMTVIGLATTNPYETIVSKADSVINDFNEISFEKMIQLRKK